MTIKQFTTSKTRKTITINKLPNGIYVAYENNIRKDGGNIIISNSFHLDYLIETVKMRYISEELEIVF